MRTVPAGKPFSLCQRARSLQKRSCSGSRIERARSSGQTFHARLYSPWAKGQNSFSNGPTPDSETRETALT
ncbi:hypothetical protein D514_0107625 [Microbacterium sp. UCD-TDU]|nr:hypothetical protein D514_0107625 [Microbacterium sp. UCD-TDU]